MSIQMLPLWSSSAMTGLGTSFFFFLAVHPRFFASRMFFAALLSARLGRLFTVDGCRPGEAGGPFIHVGKTRLLACIG